MSTALPQHAERRHHKYGMSKLNPLAACAGYVSTDGTNEAAEEGTRLHEIMDRVARSLVNQKLLRAPKLDALWTFHELLEAGQVVASDEDVPLIQACCKELNRWLRCNPNQILVEIKVHIRHPDGNELNHGHLDIALVWGKSAVLIDYKFGWIPVPAAEANWQGMGYALGCLQEMSALDDINVVFVQPRLNRRTEKVWRRSDLYELYKRVKQVIDDAESPSKTLRPNPYCDFCASADTCTALVKSAHAAVVKYEGLPLPDVFDGLEITTPEQVTVALYVLDRLEDLIARKGIRKRALELAKANGDRLEYQVNPSEKLVITVHGRKPDRTVDSPALVAEALTPALGEEKARAVVLGACDIGLGKLESGFADAFVEKRKAEAETMPKDRAKEHRVTKKLAKEILADTLKMEGLMSAPDGLIEYAKVRMEKTGALLTEG